MKTYPVTSNQFDYLEILYHAQLELEFEDHDLEMIEKVMNTSCYNETEKRRLNMIPIVYKIHQKRYKSLRTWYSTFN